MSLLSNYTRLRRKVGGILIHKTKPLFICKHGKWHVYLAIEKPKRGLPIWTANNVALDLKGYETLREAIEQADKHNPTK